MNDMKLAAFFAGACWATAIMSVIVIAHYGVGVQTVGLVFFVPAIVFTIILAE